MMWGLNGKTSVVSLHVVIIETGIFYHKVSKMHMYIVGSEREPSDQLPGYMYVNEPMRWSL